MNWMDKLERKYGRYAVPNITRYFVFANVIGYFLSMIGAGAFMQWLDFSVYDILHGQIWRLFTWVLIPSQGLSIWSLLFMLCLLMLGQNLEMGFGTFRMNVYFVGGILVSDIGGILIYFLGYPLFGRGIPVYLTMYYILFSLYLMLGLFMPDAEVRLYFVLPVRMKWLMILYAVTLSYEVFSYFKYGYSVGVAYGLGVQTAFFYGLSFGAQIILAILNLGLFVYFTKHHVSRKQRKRAKAFKAQFEGAAARPGSGITKHKCAICGRTELDDPNLTFRYCSKCAGNYEYCQDHLFTHEHVHLS